MGNESNLSPFLLSQKCPSEDVSDASISNGDVDEYHNFSEQNGINDTFLPPMVRAALMENSKPEKSGMKNEPGQESIDQQAYQLGNMIIFCELIFYRKYNLTFECLINSFLIYLFLFQING